MNINEKLRVVKSEIISCSRRTDIPAFLMDWVIDKMQIGYVDVVNPFNKKQVYRVSLDPRDVKCFVWWSKNFERWIYFYKLNRELFNSYKGHSFQFTINSPSELEGNLEVSLEDRLKQLSWLIEEFGLTSMNYRFDPIIVYKDTETERIKSNLTKFKQIIETLSSLGLKEMIFSFATIYPKVQRRMKTRGYIPIDLSLKKKGDILLKLLEICSDYDVRMKACCQPDLLNIKGIEQAHCIDTHKIEQIVGETMSRIKDSGQRKECGCSKSKDIGGYTGLFRCKHNCTYCYASPAMQ